jgi:hypothetical protein
MPCQALSKKEFGRSLSLALDSALSLSGIPMSHDRSVSMRWTIGRTLDYISSIQNSEVVFDYMEPPEAFSEELRQLEKARTEQLEKIGERSASRFEPASIAAILRSHGFRAIEDIDFYEIASRFGRTVQGLAPGHAGVHVVHAKH